MDESITRELRSVTAVTITKMLVPGRWDGYRAVFMSTTLRDSIADGIDERFTHELQAKQEEVDALRADNADLQARLDAFPPLVDADRMPWTSEDMGKAFSCDCIRGTDTHLLRRVVCDFPYEGWWLVDQYGAHYPAEDCHHGTPEPSEPTDSQERIDADARKWTCEYFDHPTGQCDDCPMRNDSTSCRALATLDLLRRQRELDGAGEQA